MPVHTSPTPPLPASYRPDHKGIRKGNPIAALGKDQRKGLAQQVLDALARGNSIATTDAFQLRKWALSPEDAELSLREIAEHILNG